MTLAEAWMLEDEDTKQIRQKYGEKYSDEAYKEWIRDDWYAQYDDAQPHEITYYKQVENSDYSINGLKALRAILGLKGAFNYNPQQLIDKQRARYAEVNPAAYEP